MQGKTLTVSLSRTFDGKPLAVLDTPPCWFSELRPDQLREVAATLLRIADDCEARPVKGRYWSPARRVYPVSGETTAAPVAGRRAV